MKLWDKGTQINKLIESFTIGKDKELDLLLAEYDVLGSIAHLRMLEKTKLVSQEDAQQLLPELKKIYRQIKDGKFLIEDGVEDVHSQVELMLTRTLGNPGKAIHTGRSRNDQVLLDIKLFTRGQLKSIVQKTHQLFSLLISHSEQYKKHLIPGYTHLQVAMPSSFGLWFGAYAESLTDDLQMLYTAFKQSNHNPLGSGAGYGSSFPLDRKMTTQLLGFEDLDYNVVYAQMGRGKLERTVTFALSALGNTLSKMAMDLCLFMSQNFGFVSFPDDLTTGSSIMPHKKNPDVLELVRAKSNKLKSLPAQADLITTNLPSGYHRDMQLLKEMYFAAFEDTSNCLDVMALMLEQINIKENIIQDEKYKYLFTVDEINHKVTQGVPFRDAYQEIARQIDDNTYQPGKSLQHTLEGSIGNLCNKEIKEKWDKTMKQFDFESIEIKLKKLVE
jgi:argininosuccinate lyase